MEILNLGNLNHLLGKTGSPLISLYMPTHRVGREMQQDPIRFKNLLSEAEQLLSEQGLQPIELESILNQTQRLQQDAEFWQHLGDGLALFISKDFLEVYRLPYAIDPLLTISDRFHIKPLLPLLNKNGHFYVLALSQKNVRLLEGSIFSIDEIDLESAPTSLQEALSFDDPEKQLQYHTMATTPSGFGGHNAAFHGQGANEADSKTDLLRYFQKIDQGLMELIGAEKAPLVLAGVDYLLPIYRQANSYLHLVDEFISGNPDQIDAEDLHQQVWKIIEPIFTADRKQAIAHFKKLRGTGSKLASTRLETILQAAYYGLVETLFATLNDQLWGKVDFKNNTLEQHQDHQVGDQDLSDVAVANTLLNSGSVFTLESDKMPDEKPLAAIFRYTYESPQPGMN